jgi:putative DNA primase/helicase
MTDDDDMIKIVRLAVSKDQPPKQGDAQAPERKSTAVPTDELITEQSVMRDFIAAYKDKLRYNHDSKLWLIWKEHYWKNDGKQRAFAWALKTCRELPETTTLHKVRFASAVEQAARAQEEVATQTEEWDADRWLLGTPEGVVELKTGELRPGRPEDMISKVAACAPAKIADCPVWEDFLDFALAGKRENIDFLQRYCGYCLTGSTQEEFLLYLVGPPGTGKGTFTKTFSAVLRDYAQSVPITMFTDASWRMEYYRAKLAGYRVILASEPEKGATWSESFVNEVTGSDRLSGRHPAGRPFDFDPTHKLLLQGNVVPDLKGVASGLRRRLGLLKFERVPPVPDLKLKDTLRGELPGILRWLITGCLAWQKDGLNPPSDVKEAVAEYFENQDVFRRWVEERCEINPTGRERPNVLRLDYNAWAQRNGERVMTYSQFHDAIENFSDPAVTRVSIQGVKWVKALTLKPSEKTGDFSSRWERD